MFKEPILKNFSNSLYDFLLLTLIIIFYIMMCAEADIYVPTFPAMINYFKVHENQIQLILSINFAGLSIASLIAGPLSDSYGRRIILIGGLFLFLIGSIGCVYCENFYAMLFWRLIQGIAASVPMVIGSTIILDKYSPDKISKIIGLLNSVITAAMAAAPIAGVWISQIWNWRANFTLILILAIISFVGTFLFIEESLSIEKRKSFNLPHVFRDYMKLLMSFEFISYTLIGLFPFTAVVVYIANLSIILINYFGISLENFSFYQATTMATFGIFSLLSVKVIDRKGIEYTKNFGGILALIGSISLFLVGWIYPNHVNMICTSMAFVAGGGAMMVGTFGIKALSLFPSMSGTAMGLVTTIRQCLAAGLVALSEIFFDGTITPVANIIFGYALICLVCYCLIPQFKN